MTGKLNPVMGFDVGDGATDCRYDAGSIVGK